MSKEQILINLSSGTLGAILGTIFGFIGSLYIYYVGSRRRSKEKLIIALIGLKNYQFARIGGIDPDLDQVAAYKRTFHEIYGLYLTYRGTFLCSRGRTEKIWCKYTGNKKCEFVKELFTGPVNNSDVEERIDALLKEIGYK